VAATLAVLVFRSDSQERGRTGGDRLARESLGFGASHVVSASVSDEAYRQMITSGKAFARENARMVQQLSENREKAEQALVSRITWSGDVDAGYAERARSDRAIAESCQPLFTDLRDQLDPADRALADRGLANIGLDADLRALDLSDAQRELILAAQRARDAVILDARNWHNEAKLAEARADFEAVIADILTNDQQAELAAHRDLIRARAVEIAREPSPQLPRM
jgi:hypothetical protein